MKILFWLGLSLEGMAALYYWYQIWMLKQGDPADVYPEKIRSLFNVAAVLSVLFIGALVARYGFKSQKAANIVVLMPVIMLVVSMVGMMLASIFVGGKWR